MGNKKRVVKSLCAHLQKGREVLAQRRAAEAEAKAQALAAEAEATAQADAGAYEAQLHQLQADLLQREQQVADTQRLQQLQQQMHDIQREEIQRKEQQVVEQQHQLQQQQADLHLREKQVAEQQHELQQQQADMHLREQQVAEQHKLQQQQQADMHLREQQVAEQHQLQQQQQEDMHLREQQVTEQQHQLQHQLRQVAEQQHQLQQQQQADMQLREKQVAEQHQLQQLQQQLNRLQQQLEAQRGAELQRQVQQQLAAQQHLLQQQQADLLLKQQQVEKQLQEAADQQAVSANHPLPDHPTCSPLVPGSLRSPLFKRPRQDTTLTPMPSLPARARMAASRADFGHTRRSSTGAQRSPHCVADDQQQICHAARGRLDEPQGAAASIAAAAVAAVLRAAVEADAAGAAVGGGRSGATGGDLRTHRQQQPQQQQPLSTSPRASAGAMRKARGNPTPTIPSTIRPVWDLRLHRQQQQQPQPLSTSPQAWQLRLQPLLNEFQKYPVEEGAELLDRLHQHRRMQSVVSLATCVVPPTPDQVLGSIMVESLRPVLAGIKPAPGGQRSTNQQPFNTALIMTMGRGIEQHGIKRTARQLGITPLAVKRARRSHLSNLAAGAAADWAAAPLRLGRRCLSQEQLEYVRTFFKEHSSPSPMYKDVRRYYVRMTAGRPLHCRGSSSKKSEVRMSRRYVDRSLKKLYLEYERECPANLKVGSTAFEILRPPWVKRITAAHKQVCVCIPCETCELQLDQLGKHMDSLELPEDSQPLDDSDSDCGSDSGGGGWAAEGVARAAEGGGTAGGAAVRVDLDSATVQSWFVCPCKVGTKPRLACLQRKCDACKDRKVGVKAGCEGVQLQYRQFNKLDNGQGVVLATVQTTLGGLVAGLNDLMQKQLWHQYLAKHQRATFRAHCAAVKNTPGLVVVSCDWSEKLTIHQDIACQGAYWKQRTMSVFVACAHYQDMAGNYREESVFVSADKCDQSAEASTTALVQVIECLLQGRRHPDGILGVASNLDGIRQQQRKPNTAIAYNTQLCKIKKRRGRVCVEEGWDFVPDGAGGTAPHGQGTSPAQVPALQQVPSLQQVPWPGSCPAQVPALQQVPWPGTSPAQVPALQQVPWACTCPALQQEPALQQLPWPGSCPAQVPALQQVPSLQQVPWPGTSPAQVPALQQLPWPGTSPAQVPALQQVPSQGLPCNTCPAKGPALEAPQRQRSIASLTDTAVVVQAEADAHFQQLAAASGGPNKKRTSRAWSGYLAWLEEAYPQQVSVARRWKQDPSASDAQVNAMLAEAQLPKAVLTTPMKQLQQTRAATGNAPPAVGWARKQLAFPTAPDSQLVAGAGPSVGLAAARLAAAPPEEAWAAPSAGSAANELAVVSPPNESGVGPSTGLASAPLQGGAGMTADSDIAAAADVLVLEILKGVRDQTGADVQPQVLKNVVSRIATNVKKEVAKALRLPLKADAAGKKPWSGYALFSGMKRAEIGNAAIAAAWQGAAQDVYAVYAAIVNNLEGRAGY
ncbi:hypothetical protein QJQ45_025957 [Haematococcus lacustris]|nr:hypothetical protein QJQ45_025957 [Haematococcus lacustris]